jgi:hypothetical protein
MKKLLLLFIGIFFTVRLIAQAIPDGNFEYWNTYTWMDPQYYNSSNEQSFNNGGTTVSCTRVAGYHGLYGVQVTGAGGTAGFFINAYVQNGPPTGGIPYNQKPTGIRFWYKYSPSGTDTAAVLVIFKNSGIAIDSMLIPITGTVSSYTAYTHYKTFPATAPDTVMFGAVSSISVLRNGSGNNGSVFTIDSVTFLGGVSQPTNFNGDFENWSPNDTLLVPTIGSKRWYVSYPNEERTTDAQTGSYALELKTATFMGIPYSSQASTGYHPNCHTGNCPEQGGQPYTLQIDTLEFAYKYSPSTGDTASVNLSFFKNGTTNNVGIYLTTHTTTYRDTIIPFNLPSAPDSVIVTINPTWHNHNIVAPYVGTVLKIDNMVFASQKNTLGTNKITVASGVKVYPNPVINVLNIEFNNLSGAANIFLYDITGREIKQKSSMVDNNITQINTSDLCPGIYFYRVVTQNGSFENKFIKE